MRSLFSLVAALLAFAAPAKAVVLTYTFQGTIYSKTDSDHLIDGMNVGDKATYVIQVDSQAANLSTIPGSGSYIVNSATLTVADRMFPCAPYGVLISSDTSNDPQSSFETAFEMSIDGLGGFGYWRLMDYDRQAISSAALPLVPYPLSPFEQKGFSISLQAPGPYPPTARLLGSFDSFTIVPEPAISVGLLLGGFLLRRRGGHRSV